jgi:hypothetical protein
LFFHPCSNYTKRTTVCKHTDRLSEGCPFHPTPQGGRFSGAKVYKKIASGASIELHLNDLEELNLRLERTMTSPLTFKSKREIIETLVRVITVETTSLDVNAGKKPSVKVTFMHQLDPHLG